MITDGSIERIRYLVLKQVPYLHQGRSMHGMDCIGAVAYALQYEEAIPTYPEDPVNGELETSLRKILGEPIMEIHPLEPLKTIEGLKPMDLLSMRYGGPIRHLAFVVPHATLAGQLSIVHSNAMLGRVTEHILDAKWLRRIAKVWRP